MQQSVYCVIVTYNGMEWIERCLGSLVASSFKNQIIVVDNGSKDGTTAFIRQHYPTVRLIDTGKNLGFGQGNNLGLKIALEEKADHVLLLNQDAWVERDTILQLIQAQTESPQFGVLSPIHLNGSGSDFDDHFYLYLTRSGIRGHLFSLLLGGQSEETIIDTPFVNAAAWMVSGDCLQKTGGFDPIFFHYGEDDNFAHRVIYKGYRIGILTSARIYHDRIRVEEKAGYTLKMRIKRDWINFLSQACDVREPRYPGFMIRSLCRFSFYGVVSLLSLNRTGVIYNFTLAGRIVRSFFRISQSRNVSKKTVTPYLTSGSI